MSTCFPAACAVLVPYEMNLALWPAGTIRVGTAGNAELAAFAFGTRAVAVFRTSFAVLVRAFVMVSHCLFVCDYFVLL